ncbi:hypothetical protein BCR34DRAFT_480424, partial [Clohesyomyces aquaticus]
EERDLEYKHRHTFIGTASLDDFLEILEMTKDHKTDKSKVTKAFKMLAANEQAQARQTSPRPEGWELVTTITPKLSDGPDYLSQAYVKLGAVTLRQFLELIAFDQHDVALATAVVEAFIAASFLDKNASSHASKARMFRRWMIRGGTSDSEV